MSVLLTAGKKSIMAKPKSAKKKKKKTNSFTSGPPVSTEQTIVWHFELNGIECTVMFDKQDMSVWCNGEDLETVDGFSETGIDGSVLDFYITLDDNTAHRGRIQRVRGDKSLTYQLIVNGCLIQERTSTGQAAQVVQCAADPELAPPYDQYNGVDGGFDPTGNSYGGVPGYGDYNGACNGLPSAAVYEPPPRYEDIMEKKTQ